MIKNAMCIRAGSLSSSLAIQCSTNWDDVAQRVARLTRNVEVLGSSPIKGPRCFPETFTLIA